MLPHPHLTHLTYPAQKKAYCLILTATEKEPKPKNQPAPQQKHEARNFKRPHPHKENKNKIIGNQPPTLLSQKSPSWQYLLKIDSYLPFAD
jgi:hypothetical protein